MAMIETRRPEMRKQTLDAQKEVYDAQFHSSYFICEHENPSWCDVQIAQSVALPCVQYTICTGPALIPRATYKKQLVLAMIGTLIIAET